ncbi:MAG: tRNA (5-methylaminomethyl-2-thiouridylate)-methyltransferase [Nanoarchaeota archaeon]|nr:tRNA (5-methylaminomethyl-2-thiouridylate)-methyltransferase [Nanoarchaeota archaeon]
MVRSRIVTEESIIIRPEVHRTWLILLITFGLLGILAGADKFLGILTYWEKYLSPLATAIVPISPEGFMMIVGAIEILAGILVFTNPRIGGAAVGVWLLFIAINLLSLNFYPNLPTYNDIAVRDIVMAMGAFALSILSSRKEIIR